MEKYYYLPINVLSVLIPLLFSFEKRVFFFSRWPGLLLGIGFTAAKFIVWNALFPEMGIWGFNPRYLSGVGLFGLPLEESLFFFTIPYACLFTYEAMNYLIKKEIPANIAARISYSFGTLLLLLGLVFIEKWYTAVTFISSGIFLILHQRLLKPHYIGRFIVGYIVCLIPFLIVNGILTGSFTPEEIVWYNDNENLGIRLFTIPVEDTIYLMLMLLMSTATYEDWKKKARKETIR